MKNKAEVARGRLLVFRGGHAVVVKIHELELELIKRRVGTASRFLGSGPIDDGTGASRYHAFIADDAWPFYVELFEKMKVKWTEP